MNHLIVNECARRLGIKQRTKCSAPNADNEMYRVGTGEASQRMKIYTQVLSHGLRVFLIGLTFVQPWQVIGGAVVARKAELGPVEGVAEVGVIVAVVVGPE
jgi:hypothetical protein